MQQSVHMVMGKGEATIIGMALALLTEHLNEELQQDLEIDDVMQVISMKFSTVHMMGEIANLIVGDHNEE